MPKSALGQLFGATPSPVFKVWDELNSDEEDAATIRAYDAVEAAERYAEDDVDGNIDGIYAGGAHPVCVRDEAGVLHRFTVGVEYEPTYSARLVEVVRAG